MFRLHRFYLDSETGAGAGGTAAPAPAPAPAPESAPAKAPDLGKAADSLVARHGDPTAALRVLIAENFGYRDQLRDLKAKLPGDGAIVIKDDEAKSWEDYRKLGSPKDLKTALAERNTYKAEADDYRKADVHRQAADLHFPGKASVLGTLAAGLEIDFTEVRDRAGKTTRQAVVKGDGDTVTPLVAYAETHWAEFLPALRAGAAPTRPGTPRPGGGAPQPPVQPARGAAPALRLPVI